MLSAAEAVMGEEAAKSRSAFLLDHTALLDDDVEPFEVLANACLGPSTVAALRVLAAPQSEFKSWKGASDAFPWLAEDVDGVEVPAWFAEGRLSAEAAAKEELTSDMDGILRRVLEERATRYGGGGVEEEERLLRELSAGDGDGVGPEGGVAVAAAVTLRLEEKVLIRRMLDALRSRGEGGKVDEGVKVGEKRKL
jgi:hypothetical protein